MVQTVKRLHTVRETRAQSLGREDLLEKEMATHCSALAWKTPWTEEPGRLQSTGVAKSRTRLSDFTHSLIMHCEHMEPTFLWLTPTGWGVEVRCMHTSLSDLHAQAILSKPQHVNLLCAGVREMSSQG